MGEEVAVTLNGRSSSLPAGTTVGEVVDRVAKDRSRVAVERNRDVVPRALWNDVALEAGDVIEVVTLVGGG